MTDDDCIMASAFAVSTEPVIIDTVPYKKLRLLDEQEIGCGAFGAVYKALHRDWGIQVAYKKLLVHKIHNFTHEKALRNEANIHRQLRHPNIVSMLGIVFEDGNYGLVLEYVSYGSLDCFLEKLYDATEKKFTVSWKVKLSISHEVCCGMSYLHSLSTPVIHCDLKRSNLLLDDRMSVKITDFGLSRWKNYSRSFSSAGKVPGTPSHVPPEMWIDSYAGLTEKFDVYSFGVLLWEMLAEEVAFENINLAVLRSSVLDGVRPPIKFIPKDVPPAVTTLVTSSWHSQPENRPTFKELGSDLTQLINSSTTVSEIQREKQILMRQYNNLLTDFSEHCRKLARHHQQLTEMLRRIDRILPFLLQQRALTQIEYDEIRLSSSALHEVIIRLLDWLNKKPQEVFQSFLEALHFTNQHYLCQLIEDETKHTLLDNIVMEKVHKKCAPYFISRQAKIVKLLAGFVVSDDHKTMLIDNYTYLQKNMQATVVLLGHLLQDDVLDQDEVDAINSKPTELDKTNELLHFLLRTPQDEYQLFLEALRKSNMVFIAEKLQKSRGQEGISKNLIDQPFLLDVNDTETGASSQVNALEANIVHICKQIAEFGDKNQFADELSKAKMIARELAHDTIVYMAAPKDKSASRQAFFGIRASFQAHAKTMRRTVDQMSDKHQILLSKMCTHGHKVNELQQCQLYFDDVAKETFEDGQYNWERIVTLYAFAGWLSRLCLEENKHDDCRMRIEQALVKFIAEWLCHWIVLQGGWGAMDRFFSESDDTESDDTESKMWTGFFYTVIGLGALATTVAVVTGGSHYRCNAKAVSGPQPDMNALPMSAESQ